MLVTMVVVTATGYTRLTRGTEPELALSDADQAAALRSAIFRSARAAGLGPDRAGALAEHMTAHLPGHLAQHGYSLRMEWTSTPARDAMLESGGQSAD